MPYTYVNKAGTKTVVVVQASLFPKKKWFRHVCRHAQTLHYPLGFRQFQVYPVTFVTRYTLRTMTNHTRGALPLPASLTSYLETGKYIWSFLLCLYVQLPTVFASPSANQRGRTYTDFFSVYAVSGPSVAIIRSKLCTYGYIYRYTRCFSLFLSGFSDVLQLF